MTDLVRRARAFLAASAAALVAGCSFAPAYQPPSTPAVAAFKETGRFTLAAPADALPGTGWWTLYRDPTLDALEARIDAGVPSLAEAFARYQQSQDLLLQAQAGLGPTVGVSGYTTGDRQSDDRPLRGSGQPNEYMANSLTGAVDYELDLWGRVRNAVAAGRAEAQASGADFAQAKLSLQAELADTYVRMRGLDDRLKLLQATVQAYGRAYAVTDRRHSGGVSSGVDLSRAKAQLSSARAELSDTAAERALLEHAIAALVGQPASTFTLAVSDTALRLPDTPPGLPSTLLQRRPDIAAAERRVAEANAEIGVARAAFFPTISLDASGGFQSTQNTSFFTPGDTLWSFGPSAALTLFDFGRRHAVERAAFAARVAAAAEYRERVLLAFQQVEDSLALLNRLSTEAADQSDAVAAAGRTEALSTIRYEKGATTLLDVVVAQTAALQARRAALELNTRRLQASVELIRALGGGWSGQESLAQAGGASSPLREAQQSTKASAARLR